VILLLVFVLVFTFWATGSMCKISSTNERYPDITSIIVYTAVCYQLVNVYRNSFGHLFNYLRKQENNNVTAVNESRTARPAFYISCL